MEESRRSEQQAAAKLVTLAAFAAIFTYSFIPAIAPVIINEMIDAFSLTGASQGLMSSMTSAGVMLSIVIAPLMQGRVPKLTMLFAACALEAVMLAACGAAPGFAAFCICCVVLGVGCGLVDSYSNSCIVDVHGENSPKTLGMLHGIFGIGSLAAPLVIHQIGSALGWRGVHFAMAILPALSALAVLAISRRAGRMVSFTATKEAPLSRADVVQYVRGRRNLFLLLASFFASVTQTALIVWAVRYMTVRFDAEALGTLGITAFWVCATVNRFSIARIKVRPMRLFVIGSALAAVFIAAGVLSGSAVAMCVAMGATGLSIGHLLPVLFSECALGYAGKTTFTTSVMLFSMGFGRIVAPLLAAGVSSLSGVSAGILSAAGAAVLAVVFGTVVLRFPVPRPAVPAVPLGEDVELD